MHKLYHTFLYFIKCHENCDPPPCIHPGGPQFKQCYFVIFCLRTKRTVMLLNWERSRGVFVCQGLTLPNDAKLHHYFLRAIWLIVLYRHAVWLPVRQLQCALSLGESSISPVLTVITLHAWLTLSVNARTLSAPAELFHRSSICFWLLLFNSFCFRLNGQHRIKPFFRIIYKPIIYGMLGNYFSCAVFTALINDQLDCLKGQTSYRAIEFRGSCSERERATLSIGV